MTNLSSLSKAKISLLATVLACLSGIVFGQPLIGLALGLPFIGVAFYFIMEVQKSIIRVSGLCTELGNGNFGARLTNIQNDGEISDLMWSVNDMADKIDSYVRESAAAMEYVSRNQYFRRILENGMQGSLLHGARIINRATESVAEKMVGFGGIANDVDVSLKDVVGQINQAVDMLQSNAKDMGQTVAATRQGSKKVIDSANGASESVQTISAAAEEMSAAVAEISEQVTRTANISNAAVKDTEDARNTIQNLAATAESISEVIGLIEEIADQTNLLALNATIEAARAGDAGKGFAVVASEVKDLAGETAKATEQIRSQITEVQQATANSVSAFDKIGKIIMEVSQACSVVAAAVEEQNTASKEIAENAERASNSTLSAASSVNDIGAEIDQVDNYSTQLMSTTEALSMMSKDHIEALLTKMDGFMVELRKIA